MSKLVLENGNIGDLKRSELELFKNFYTDCSRIKFLRRKGIEQIKKELLIYDIEEIKNIALKIINVLYNFSYINKDVYKELELEVYNNIIKKEFINRVSIFGLKMHNIYFELDEIYEKNKKLKKFKKYKKKNKI